ncbi:MAG: glycosyltransferase [bacterium]
MRILLIQNIIANYNRPIFNLISEQKDIELTVAHFNKNSAPVCSNFKELMLEKISIGSFVFSKKSIYSICNKFDVVISLADLHWINLMLLGLHKKRKFKLIYWGIGVSASYSNKYDQNKKWDIIRFFLMRRADALLFYSSYPINKYVKYGFPIESLFIADNTIQVSRSNKYQEIKNSILFIGTLYKEKGIYELLDSYFEVSKKLNLPQLNIIGDGDEFIKIQEMISFYKLDDKIKMLGPIYDDIILENYFSSAIACISPNQAGLSVLQSMGFEVPFITKMDAITGGEIFNITNNLTGILYKNELELNEILFDITNNTEKYIEMGRNAKIHYDKCRTPRHMSNGFLNAINYVIQLN